MSSNYIKFCEGRNTPVESGFLVRHNQSMTGRETNQEDLYDFLFLTKTMTRQTQEICGVSE